MATVSLPTSLADVDAGGTFKIPAPGEYTLEVKKADVKQSAAGNTMINVGLQIIEDDEFTGSYVWETLVLIDSCMFKVKQFLLSAGLDTDVSELDLEEFLGCEVTAILDIEKYEHNGKEGEKAAIKRYVFDEE